MRSEGGCAAIYVRVSTEDQARRGYSLGEQTARCTARARQLGAARILRYVDEGVPGELWDRPGLSALRAAAEERRFELFVCVDPDRLARKLVHQLLATDLLERRRIRIEFVDFEWKATPEGQLFAQMRGAIAEYEKAKIRARTTLGRRAKARKGGLPHYTRPYGYRWERGCLVVDQQEAAAVRDAFRWFNAEPDLGYAALARRMQAQHPPRRGAWDGSTLARLLKNPAYAGELHVERYDAQGSHLNRFRPRGERIPYRRPKPPEQAVRVPVPALVAAGELEAAREKAAAISRNRGRPPGDFLLSRLVRCGLCGSPMRGKTQRSGGRTYRYYACRGGGRGGCGARQAPAEELEDAVWAEVLTWVSDPGGLARDLAAQHPEEVRGRLEEEGRQVRAMAGALDREEGRVWSAWRRGLVTETRFSEAVRDIARRRAALSRRLAGIEARRRGSGAPGAEAVAADELRRRVTTRLSDVAWPTRRAVILELLTEVEVRPGRLRIHARRSRGDDGPAAPAGAC